MVLLFDELTKVQMRAYGQAGLKSGSTRSEARCSRTPRQQIPDLGEQFFRSRGLARFGFFFPLQPVEELDNQEQDEGDDDEIDSYSYEVAIRQDRACFLGVGKWQTCFHRRTKRKIIIRKIEPASRCADCGHDDIANHRSNDCAERCTDDHADCQINNIASKRELFEVGEHAGLLGLWNKDYVGKPAWMKALQFPNPPRADAA